MIRINNAKPPMSAGPSHHQYGMPRGPPRGPNGENQSRTHFILGASSYNWIANVNFIPFLFGRVTLILKIGSRKKIYETKYSLNGY